jgi:hypothetical protein
MMCFNELFTGIGTLAVVQTSMGEVEKTWFGPLANGHIGRPKITMPNSI